MCIRGCLGCILCQKRLRLSQKWTSVSPCVEAFSENFGGACGALRCSTAQCG